MTSAEACMKDAELSALGTQREIRGARTQAHTQCQKSDCLCSLIDTSIILRPASENTTAESYQRKHTLVSGIHSLLVHPLILSFINSFIHSLRCELELKVCELRKCCAAAFFVERTKDRNQPLGPSSSVGAGSFGGSGMLQSVPAQVVSQLHVPSLLQTCAEKAQCAKGRGVRASS